MRYKKSILPNEANNVYVPKQQFSITLPRKKLDLSTFTLHYSGNTSCVQHLITFNDTGVRKEVITNIGTAVAPVYSVDTAANVWSITIPAHGLGNADDIAHVIYDANGQTPIAPLVSGNRYILRVVNNDTVRVLNPSVSNAYDTTIIQLSSRGTGTQYFKKLERKYKSISRNFPRLASCVLTDVSVSIENRQIQHLRQYNTLASILNDIQNEYDDVDSTTPDSIKQIKYSTTANLLMESKILPFTRTSTQLGKYVDSQKQQFFISKWLGFLGESSRFFDATNQEVKITFKLAPPNILYKGLTATDEIVIPHQLSYTDTTPYVYDTDYELYDIKATIDVLDDIPLIDKFVFKDYSVQEGLYVASNKKSLTLLSIDKPVEWVLGTFKQPDYETSDTGLQLMHCNSITAKFGESIKSKLTIDDINALRPKDLAFSYEISKLQKDPYVLNSSLWFSHQGDGIRYTKYRWNGYDLTPNMNMTMCYSETKKCFNTDFKKVPSILSFEADFFANAVRVDDNSTEYKKIEWEVEVDETKPNRKGGQPMLFCCYMNQL